MSNAAIRSSRMTTEDRETSSLEMGGEGKVVLVEVYKNLSEDTHSIVWEANDRQQIGL